MSRMLHFVFAILVGSSVVFAAPPKPTTQPARRVVSREQFEKSVIRNGMRLIWERTDAGIKTDYQLWQRGGLDI